MTENLREQPSWRVYIEGVGEHGASFAFEASEQERRALAKRFELVSIGHFAVEGLIVRGSAKGRYRLEGCLEASVVQTCVVTLEPVASDIRAEFVRDYGVAIPAEPAEIVLGLRDSPIVEAIAGDAIEVSDAACEQLGLELDPFPRAVGAVFDGYSTDGGEKPEPTERPNPFSALSVLSGRRDSES